MAASSAVYTTVATLNAGQTAYDCVSTGTSRDGTKEVVVATFVIKVQTSSTPPWGYNVFYFAGYSGGALVGSGLITGPFYMKFPAGSGAALDFGSSGGGFVGGPVFIENANLTLKSAPPAPIEIYTNGTVTLEGTAKSHPELVLNRGWDPAKALPITLVNVPSYLSAALANATAQSSDNVMGNTTVANYEALPAGSAATYSALATNPPNNRPAGWVRSKALGAGQAYKVISGGLTIGPSTPSWGSWSGDGHYPTSGDLHDDFAYDAVNHVLYVEGTVYIDGNLTISTGRQTITYVGDGTLVCTGNVTIGGSIVPATANGPDGTPEPDARHLLCVFSGGTVSITQNNLEITGAFYTVGQFAVTGNNDTIKGSFVAEQGLTGLANGTNIVCVPLIGSYVSPGLPSWGGGSGSTTTLSMSGWHRQ
jgi:hypothetical protein